MTHTPGPWWALVSDFAGVGAKREINGAREDCWIVPPGFLFDEKNPPTREELHANARLIAKAWLIPELIAALNVYRLLDVANRAGCKIGPEDWAECWQAATEVLAKVKGEDE